MPKFAESLFSVFQNNPSKLAFAALSLIILTGFVALLFKKDRVEIRFVILLILFGGVAAVLYAIDPPGDANQQIESDLDPLPMPHPTSMDSETKDSNDRENVPEPIVVEDQSSYASPSAREAMPPQASSVRPPADDEKIRLEMVRLSDNRPTYCGLYVVPRSDGGMPDTHSRILCQEGTRWTYETDRIDGGWAWKKKIASGMDVVPEWRDEDGDGLKDYCRAIGDHPKIVEVCLLAPTFTRELSL